MSILVTGAAGFIGSNFLQYKLEKDSKSNIIALDKLTYAGNIDNIQHLINQYENQLKFIIGDINDSNLIEKLFNDNEIDAVINFAAETHVDRSIVNPHTFLDTNVLGTHTLLNIAKKFWLQDSNSKRNKRFIQISTDEVYGSLGESGFFTEKSPLNPRSPYSASKASADLIVKAYHETYGLPINITRCSNNYGPYQFPEKLIPLMISNALAHKKLPVYGDGKNIRDWLYVGDHCEAIDVVLTKGINGEIYNIGGNNEFQNIDIVKRIISLLNEKTSDNDISIDLIEYVKDRLGHDRRYAIDASKIKSDLGWEPKIDFSTGIKLTIEWYLSNSNWIKKIISGEYQNYYREYYTNRL